MRESTITDCPEPEQLAAFVEGTLDDATRIEIEHHAAGCGECPTIIAETARFLRVAPALEVRPKRPSGRWSLLAAAVVIGALLLVCPWIVPRDPLQRVKAAAAAENMRATEGRLSGFVYRRFHEGRGDRGVGPRVGPIREESASALHARGLAALISGDPSTSVPLLQKAAAISQRAEYWSDLAAAQISLGARSDDEGHAYRNAIRSAEHALSIDMKLASAHFNRGVAWEHLARPDDALRSYRQALDADPSSPWAGETRERISRLESQLRGDS